MHNRLWSTITFYSIEFDLRSTYKKQCRKFKLLIKISHINNGKWNKNILDDPVLEGIFQYLFGNIQVVFSSLLTSCYLTFILFEYYIKMIIY